VGPGDLTQLIAPLTRMAGSDARILVGPETADDAGVFLLDGTALVATVDFITPVSDEPYRFGRVAAANSLSDVFAMGGQPLFALNVCCFPERGVPDGVYADILRGAAEAVHECGAALLGGHSVGDEELKFGLAVVGRADPDRVWANAYARAGDRLILTKPLGTGVLINAYKAKKLSAEALEPALVEMERLNAKAKELGLAHGVHAATDITGFALAGHVLEMARASRVGVRIRFAALPVHDGFFKMVRRGVTTQSTADNERNVRGELDDLAGLDRLQREVLFDPQTSGGLLLAAPPEHVDALLTALLATGHSAAEVGEVFDGPSRLEIV
jgi:selenide,water dikinase